MEKITSTELEKLHQFGHSVIDATRKLVLNFWNSKKFSTVYKDDLSPVTEVDKEAEVLIRELISKNYPNHGLIGEEFGVTNPDSEFQWTIDPIDGTQSLVNHIPTFCTLLGLLYRGQPVLGFIDHPALNIYCYGGQGLGVFCNTDKLKALPANLPPSENDILTLPTYHGLKKYGLLDQCKVILEMFPYSRVYYDNFAATLLCKGSIAAMVDLGKIWDVTPVQAMTLELGGKIHKTVLADNHTLWVLGRENIVNLIVERAIKNKI